LENRISFKAVAGWVGNEGLFHKFFKILFVLCVDEIGDLVGYILNERATLLSATREVYHKESIGKVERARNLLSKGVGKEEE
jgi:hypothetical protein